MKIRCKKMFSLVDGWIKEMCNIYTMKYDSAVKEHKIIKFLDKLIELEIIILAEVILDQI